MNIVENNINIHRNRAKNEKHSSILNIGLSIKHFTCFLFLTSLMVHVYSSSYVHSYKALNKKKEASGYLYNGVNIKN